MSNSNFWSVLIPAVVAGLVGASVGILGIRWQFRHESKERYESRLIDALADVMKEISIYAKFSKSRISDDDVRDFDLIAATDIALMVAKDEDLKMIYVIKRAIEVNRELSNEYLQLKLGELSSTISEWRSGKRTYKQCLRRIENLTIWKS